MVGIDAISYYVPQLYLSIEDLAKLRNIEYAKLNKGLGLHRMAVPDMNEDAASFAANALLRLIRDNNINPKEIGRVYLGTESALDASKPTATYAIEAVEDALQNDSQERLFSNCDVVDMTFACIGAVDALQNCLDWVRANPSRKAVVIASDVSKYELNSTGEYTQGAGAVAVLVTANPSILTIDDQWGIGTKSEGDFFKPRRTFTKNAILEDLVANLDLRYSKEQVEELLNASNSEFWTDPSKKYELFKEEPVFDGQFSNQCYSDRITEAFAHFQKETAVNYLEDWQHLVFHLPYAYHGRRIIYRNWIDWLNNSGKIENLYAEIGHPEESDPKQWKRSAVKSELYKEFINSKIAPSELASSEIGNMYTASIFMSLLSLLANSVDHDIDLGNETIGFIAYGSGSKSKVFQGQVVDNYQNKIKEIKLFEALNSRKGIDIETYEAIHTSALDQQVAQNEAITISHVETDENIRGLRKYKLQSWTKL